jgi:GntR family transcriptional regulator
MFILDPHSGIPIYRQILEQVRRKVASGQLKPGDELPSVRDVAVEHAVNPMTISKAYSLLQAEGLLEHNRGKPMTVAAQTRVQSPVSRRIEQIEPLVAQVALAARQLQLSQADVIKLLRRKWEQDHE